MNLSVVLAIETLNIGAKFKLEAGNQPVINSGHVSTHGSDFGISGEYLGDGNTTIANCSLIATDSMYMFTKTIKKSPISPTDLKVTSLLSLIYF